jgi:hypothetical protein
MCKSFDVEDATAPGRNAVPNFRRIALHLSSGLNGTSSHRLYSPQKTWYSAPREVLGFSNREVEVFVLLESGVALLDDWRLKSKSQLGGSVVTSQNSQ